MVLRRRRQELLLAAGSLLCVVVAWHSFWMFDGTEFGGGTLASKKDLGAFLFVLAAILALKYLRAAAASALVGSVLSLPLYLYLVFPRPFRQVWPGPWKTIPRPETFIWDGWWVAGIFFIAFVVYISCSSFYRSTISRAM